MNGISEKYITKILNMILDHEGQENPVSVSTLMETVPLSDRQIRKIVRYLINEELQPLGSKSSLPAGYFRVMNIDDYIEAISNLNPRSKKIEERALNLAKACNQDGIEIPDIHISNYKNNSKITVHIHNSVVFLGNEKEIIK